MLNHAVRTFLPLFHDQLRTSVLGHATGRRARNLQQPPGGVNEDEVVRSAATNAHIGAFFDAWFDGDEHAQVVALNDVVDAWRADNAAGGVPVHAHLPLPRIVGDVLAEHTQFGESGESKSAIAEAIARLEPGARALVSQQLLSIPPRPADSGREPSRLHNLASLLRPNDEGNSALGVAREWQSAALRALPVSKVDGMKVADTVGRGSPWDNAAHLLNNNESRAPSFELLSSNNPRSRGQQPPNRLKTKILSSNNQGGRINSQRNFELDQPSKRGGYIIQEVWIIFRPRMRDGSLGPPRMLHHFWEAWEVQPGDKHSKEGLGSANDSVRFERGPGGGGRVEILTRAIFYDGLGSLPPSFRKNGAPGTPGFDPSIEPAGNLRATSRPFALPRGSYESMTNAENNAIFTEW